MKKTFIFMSIAIILGSVSGIILFKNYKNSSYVFNEGKKLYFLEEGVYTTKDSLNNNTKDMKPKIILKDNNKYHVYLGITSNIDNAKKLKKIYKEKGYQVYLKEINVDNDEFLTNISQYDILLNSSNSYEDIKTIEEIVLGNYENLVR